MNCPRCRRRQPILEPFHMCAKCIDEARSPIRLAKLKVRRDKARASGMCTACFVRTSRPSRNRCEHCTASSNLSHARANREKVNYQARLAYYEGKSAILHAYGNICACCGEADSRFLTLDHVNNDGAAHRRELHGGKPHRSSPKTLWKWARDNGFPDSLQILCWNCNLGKDRYGGTCPHKLPLRANSSKAYTPKLH